jgi:hypothetical protein
MGDKNWIYDYDPNVRQVRSSAKSKLIVFSTWRGLFTMNLFLLTLWWTDFYCDVLRHLRENMRQKRPDLWCNHNWLLHHDNEPHRTSLKTTEFVTNNNMVIIPHPSYSLDLAPFDLALFPELKMNLKGWRFETVSAPSGTRLPRCFWCVEKTIGSLYTFPRRLFWRRWQPRLE